MGPQERVALVTGASRGIGKAIAKELASQGILVIINYRANTEAARQTQREIQEKGGQATLCPFDVADIQAVEKGFQEILRSHSRLDILVN
ncbi:MAG: SDR family NAD(P)-dependent oxidoreductase, partial [Nitrospinota bacterium]